MPALYGADDSENEGEGRDGVLGGSGRSGGGTGGGGSDNNWSYWDPSWVADCKKFFLDYRSIKLLLFIYKKSGKNN